MTVLTPHGLQTQDFKDRDWHTKLNDTITRTNDRLPSSYAGDPNGNVIGHYVGQPVYDRTNGILYVCSVVGDAENATWTRMYKPYTGPRITKDAFTESAVATEHRIVRYRRTIRSQVPHEDPEKFNIYQVKLNVGPSEELMKPVQQNTTFVLLNGDNSNNIIGIEGVVLKDEVYQFSFDQIQNEAGVITENYPDDCTYVPLYS